jgi:hypothetical protein
MPKYIKRIKKNGKWKYYYTQTALDKDRAKKEKLKEQRAAKKQSKSGSTASDLNFKSAVDKYRYDSDVNRSFSGYMEGQSILQSKKTVSGRKMSEGELSAVKRSVENSKKRILDRIEVLKGESEKKKPIKKEKVEKTSNAKTSSISNAVKSAGGKVRRSEIADPYRVKKFVGGGAVENGVWTNGKMMIMDKGPADKLNGISKQVILKKYGEQDYNDSLKSDFNYQRVIPEDWKKNAITPTAYSDESKQVQFSDKKGNTIVLHSDQLAIMDKYLGKDYQLNMQDEGGRDKVVISRGSKMIGLIMPIVRSSADMKKYGGDK